MYIVESTSQEAQNDKVICFHRPNQQVNLQ